MTDPVALVDSNDLMPKFQRSFEFLSKGWIPLLAGIYASGYIVVSIYHASLGLNEINPLRPAVAAAGILFLALSSLAIYLLGYVGSASIRLVGGMSKARGTIFLFCFCGLDLYCADVFTGFTLSLLFHPAGDQQYKVAFPVLVLAGFTMAALIFSRRSSRFIQQLTSHWAFTVLCGLALAVLLVMSVPFQGQFGVRQFASYLFVVQFMSASMGKVLFDSSARGAQSWTTAVVNLILPLIVYGALVYPHMHSALGGGDPTMAQFLLSPSDLSRPGDLLTAKIVDETDAGFYVLEGSDKEVSYIPRGSVKSIKFNRESGRWPF